MNTLKELKGCVHSQNNAQTAKGFCDEVTFAKLREATRSIKNSLEKTLQNLHALYGKE